MVQKFKNKNLNQAGARSFPGRTSVFDWFYVQAMAAGRQRRLIFLPAPGFLRCFTGSGYSYLVSDVIVRTFSEVGVYHENILFTRYVQDVARTRRSSLICDQGVDLQERKGCTYIQANLIYG